MESIALIPARGGSKRIPQKNIKEFCGKPIIYWTIRAALESNIFKDIIISSDDSEIIDIARGFGVKAPFVRPKKISGDYSTTHEVVFHAIKKLNELGVSEFNSLCCLYPCSPLINPSDIKASYRILESNPDKYIYPVTEYSHPISRAFSLDKDNKINFLHKENEKTRTQDLITYYHDAGQFYWASRKTWLNSNNMHTNAIAYKIPHWRTVDIDTIEDWKRAELIFHYLENNE